MKTSTFLKMMALMAGLMLLTKIGWGQDPFSATYTFGADGNVQSFTYNGTTYDGIIMGNILKVGVTTSSSTGNFRATNWPTGATNASNVFTGTVDLGKYIGLTIDAEDGYKFTVTSITFGVGRSGTGTRQSQWRGSDDNYGSILNNYTTLNIGLSNDGGVLTNPDENSSWTGNTLTLGGEYEDIEGVVGFRYYLYNAEAGTGTAGLQGPITITGTYQLIGGVPTVSIPQFDPPAGIYYATQYIEISTLTEGATIYYTTDGSDPDENSFIYTDPIAVSSTTTLKARAYKDGYDPSNIATALYNFPTINNVADIAALRAGTADGVTVYKLTGEAILTAKDAFNNRKFLEDETAAIMIFDTPGIITGTYNLGDGLINVTGTLTIGNNMLRFVPVLNADPASSTGNPLIPTIFEIDELTSADQAKLVRFENVSFTTTGNFANGQNYTITDGITNMVLRTDFWDVDYIGQSIPTVAQNITGVIIQFNDVIQIVPRFLADFEEAVFDVDPPQAFAATTVDSDQINLTFTTNPANNDIVIVYNGTGTFSDPSGTPPDLGEAFAGGLLLYVGKTSPVAHTGLTAATAYYYRAWSYDGANYSPGLSSTATTLASEPSDHVTEFLATTNSSSSITLTWKDFDAEAYLVKASSIGYNSISAPVDGVPEADGTLVKNVGAGIEEVEFTGLAASTEYFFKIYPYNGSDALINYKTDGEVPETSATTDVGPVVPVVFTQWNFDASNLVPNIGSGTASNVGGTSSAFAAGATGQGWNTSAYPAQGNNSGTAGVQFTVSTNGYKNIEVTWDHRHSNTSANRIRLKYTINGTDWIDFEANASNAVNTRAGNDVGFDNGRYIADAGDAWYVRSANLGAISGANNNPSFAVCIVSEFVDGSNYGAANPSSSYLTTGTWRFDNVTFSGLVLPPAEPAKLAITDVNGGLPPTVNVPFEVTVQSQDEDGILANVIEDTEVTLTLATGTGALGGTLVGTILSGQNTIVFNNVTYDTGETGVSITASTTEGMTLDPATSNLFEVVSPATQLAFVGFPSVGVAQSFIPAFTVEARRPNNTVDPDFTGMITLSKESGVGNVSGTLAVAAINGVATFNLVCFDVSGQYTLSAAATGLASATSEPITVEEMPENIIASWNFNNDNLYPSLGQGTAANVGGTSTAFAAGLAGNPDRGWNTSAYPSPETGSGTAGVQFTVSTSNYENILVSWDHRHSNSSANRIRLKYTLNGTDWIDFNATSGNAVNTRAGNDVGFDNGRYITDAGDSWYVRSANFGSIIGANNNPSFAVRIVSEFVDDSNYGSSDPSASYLTSGTWRFDNVTFLVTIPEVPENLTVDGVTLGDLDVECYDATNNITVTNTTIGNGASVEFRAGVNIIFGDGFIAEEGSYVLALITDVYCTLPPAMLASEEVVIPTELPVIADPGSMFRAYPNPTSGNITLEISGTEGSSKMLAEIYNMMGDRMMHQEISGAGSCAIDLSAMPRGIYILRVIIDGKTQMQKIIRQ